MSILDQIRHLEDLQKVDAKILEFKRAAEEAPSRLKTMSANLEVIENLLAQERAQLADAERYYQEQERELKLEEEQIQKAKTKLAGVKNSKEYMATTRELEQLRKMASDREEEVIKIMEAVEKSRESIKQHDLELTELRKEVSHEDAKAKAKAREIEGLLAETQKAREGVVGRVRPDFMRRYSRIKLSRGLAVVPVKFGTCTGCHMNLPPQLYNTLQSGGEELFTCPTCLRVIYYEAPPAEDAPE